MSVAWLDEDYRGEVFDFYGRPAWSLTNMKTGRGKGGFAESLSAADVEMQRFYESDRNGSFFMVIEGTEGVGKSTLLKALANVFDRDYFTATAEPRGGMVAYDYIRAYLTGNANNCSLHTIALAYALNRADHVDTLINPLRRAKRQLIVSDRYLMSSLVYQSEVDADLDRILDMNREAPIPDLTLLLQADPDTLIDRLHRRNSQREIFDDRVVALAERYANCAEWLQSKGHIVQTVNANQSAAEVLSDVLYHLSRYAPLWLPVQ